MAIFTKFYEAGRLCIGRFGQVENKHCIITEIVTLKRVVVEGPEVPRQVVPTKWLDLTDFKVEIARGAGSADVAAALKSDDVVAKWNKTERGKKRNTKLAKKALNDFERFKAVRALNYIKEAAC